MYKPAPEYIRKNAEEDVRSAEERKGKPNFSCIFFKNEEIYIVELPLPKRLSLSLYRCALALAMAITANVAEATKA